MITPPEIGTIPGAEISAVAHEGFTVRLPDGRHARLAVVDDDGQVIAAGAEVEREAWAVAAAAWRNFLIGRGFMRVRTRNVPSGEDG
jgi:hypothetical protein